MRRLRLPWWFAPIILFVGLVAGGLLAPDARADSGQLVDWAGNNGFVGTPQAVIIRGSLVCADLAMGMNGEQAAQDLWLNTGIQTVPAARLFVIAAVVNLCPQFDHRGEVIA